MKFYLNEDPNKLKMKSLRKKNSNKANRHCEINKSQRPLHVQFLSILFKIIINVYCLHIYWPGKVESALKTKTEDTTKNIKKTKNTILFNDR